MLPSFHHLDARYDSDDASSSCSELETMCTDDDMDAPWRWAASLSIPPRVCHLDEIHGDGAAGLADFINRPISPSDIRDFPFLSKTMPDCDGEYNPYAEELDELLNDSVVPEPLFVRSVGIGDEYRLCRLVQTEDGAMCDGGANVCMGKDRSKLRRVHKIKPIAIGMAMKSVEPT